jgi:transcriptional regulator with XRE-family HTH domain
MSRRAFSEDDFSESSTLQNVSANLQTIKRMMGWGTTEMSKQIGISDRHLDSLLRMTSNVTVLVLEKIAEGLGIPFQRLTGTRIVVRGHVSGSDFLQELQKEPWQISSEDIESPVPRVSREAPSRKAKKDVKAPEEPALPPGMEGIFQRLIDVQERLTKDQSRTDAKVDKLAEQMQDLASAVRGQASSAATANSDAAGSGRGGKGSRKGRTASEDTSSKAGKGGRAAPAWSRAGAAGSSGRTVDPDGDLFDRSAPEAPARRGRRPAAEGASRTTREAALKSRGHESDKKAGPTKEDGRTKRPYNRKK